jgi:hypothetical protein
MLSATIISEGTFCFGYFLWDKDSCVVSAVNIFPFFVVALYPPPPPHLIAVTALGVFRFRIVMATELDFQLLWISCLRYHFDIVLLLYKRKDYSL